MCIREVSIFWRDCALDRFLFRELCALERCPYFGEVCIREVSTFERFLH